MGNGSNMLKKIILTLKNIIHLNASINELKEQVVLTNNYNESFKQQVNEWLREIIAQNDNINEMNSANYQVLKQQLIDYENQRVNSLKQKFEGEITSLYEQIEELKYKVNDLNNQVYGLTREIGKTKEYDIGQVVYNINYEYNLLQKINMTALVSHLFRDKVSSSTRVNVLGYYAEPLCNVIKEYGCETSSYKPGSLEAMVSSAIYGTNKGLVYPKAIKNAINESDTTIFLNAALTKMLLDDYTQYDITSRVKSNLVLLVPNQENKSIMSASWDNGFSGLEKSESDVYYRWYVGVENTANIYIYNNNEYNIEGEISFYINTLDTSAQIEIFINEQYMLLDMAQNSQKVLLKVMLVPGNNELGIKYYGEGIKLTPEARKLKFGISDLTIRSKEQILLDGIQAHKYLVDDYNPFIKISDEIIRDTLHNNGFFEIESLSCSKDSDSLELIARSRYYEPSFSYVFIENREEINQSNVIVYIARRGGRISDE